MGVLRDFRALTEAVNGLSEHIRQARAVQAKSNPSEARLEELERSRALFEADMEALLMKAEGKLQAANNAESRTRTMKKSYEKLVDPFDLDSEEVEAPVSGGYAPLGEEEGVQQLYMDVAPNNKTRALRAKFL